MTLPAPVLDDRTFQDIVDEAKKRIPAYFDDWTDHNVSDPGVTLIELFAWMTEMLTYRLNQVPELHVSRFLEMFGMQRQPPQPAQAAVTFRFSEPQPFPIFLPQGTEVSTTQTETEPSVTFATESAVTVHPPQLDVLLQRRQVQDGGGETVQRLATAGQSLLAADRDQAAVEPLFSADLLAGEAVYFGFANDVSGYTLQLHFRCEKAGGNDIIGTRPPLVWEALVGGGDRWQPLGPPEKDTTGGFNTDGRVLLHAPPLTADSRGGFRRYWLRVRLMSTAERAADGRKAYAESPRVSRVWAAAAGCTVPVVHAERMPRELLGYSDGAPGQTFRLRATPVIARTLDEHLVIVPPNGSEGAHEAWFEVADFAEHGPDDCCYTLDSATGEIRLPPAIRSPDGQVRFHGAVPPRGAAVYFTRYRYHTGRDGNVGAGQINTLKSSIPFVAGVSNQRAAGGGRDLESMAHLQLRATRQWRTVDRAVTAQDYEWLTWQFARDEISRVKCLQPHASEQNRVPTGTVFVLALPRLPQTAAGRNGRYTADQLVLSPDLRQRIARHLNERRLLTTRLAVQSPQVHWVHVELTALLAPTTDARAARLRIEDRLNQFLNPFSGGPEYTGWPFGRSLHRTDIFVCLQHTPGVLSVQQIKLFAADEGGNTQGDPQETIFVAAHGLIAAHAPVIHLQEAA